MGRHARFYVAGIQMMQGNNCHHYAEKWAAAKHKPARPHVIKHKTVIARDTVVHVLTEGGKRETEREKTRATINSTLVMRGERKGHRETERMERQRGEKQTWRTRHCLSRRTVHNPKLFFYSLLKQRKSENNQCKCNTAMNIIIVINPKRSTYTQVIFGSLNKQPIAFTSSKTKEWKESGECISQLCGKQLRFMLLRAKESYQKTQREI